jgi:hypothetical protein
MLRDGAGAGYVSAVSNERTLGDVLGEALLEPADLIKVVKAHPRSVRPGFDPSGGKGQRAEGRPE